MDILRLVSDIFWLVTDILWSENFWLPSQVTWADVEPRNSYSHTNYTHLIIPIPLAVVLLGLRKLLQTHCFAPLGIMMGIVEESKRRNSTPNTTLENAYSRKGGTVFEHSEIVGLAKQVDWSERQVQRWLRIRRAADRQTNLVRFCDVAWRWMYFSASFTMGLICLWNKPWLWDIKYCYYNFPHQGITRDCWWYYMFSLAFYWALTFSQFFDVRRKDFWQMFIHHTVTIALLSFSWVCNLHRMGTIVLLVHDCADIFVEAAKFFKYAQYEKTCKALFAFFTVLWIVTRCIIFPFWIIRSTLFTAPAIIPMSRAFYLLEILLTSLLVLHIIWTYIIVKILFRSLLAGQVQDDLPSSSSEERHVTLSIPITPVARTSTEE